MKQNESATSAGEKMSPQELRAAATLALIFFLRMTGLFMITPVFALYAGQLAGATATLIGLAIGIYGLTQALLQIPFGMASDRWGRKPVITLGLLIFIFGSAVAALGQNIYGVILGRALQGAGAVGAATLALAADLTRDEQRLKAMAIIGITIGLAFPTAFIAGPIVSGHFGTPAVFWLAALLGLLALIVLYLLVPQPATTRFHRDCEYNPGQFWEIIRNPQLARVDYGAFTLHSVMTATFVVTPVILQDVLKLPLDQHWHLYLPTLLLSILALGPLFRISEGQGRMREMFLLSIGLLAGAQAGLYFFSTSFWGMACMLVGFFTALNFLEASQPSLVSRLAPAAARGTAMGIYSTAQFLGIFFGGAMGGWLSGRYGAQAVYLFNAILTSLWLLPTLSMPKLKQVRNRVLRVGELSATEVEALTGKLLAVPGVVEAVVIGEDGSAYLKIDPAELDATALAAFADKQQE
jgi:MFS family permease